MGDQSVEQHGHLSSRLQMARCDASSVDSLKGSVRGRSASLSHSYNQGHGRQTMEVEDDSNAEADA